MTSVQFVILVIMSTVIALPPLSAVQERALVEIEQNISRDVEWLETADSLMKELTALDVMMHTLNNNVGNPESRAVLVIGCYVFISNIFYALRGIR